jgi:hypothetical protein
MNIFTFAKQRIGQFAIFSRKLPGDVIVTPPEPTVPVSTVSVRFKALPRTKLPAIHLSQ